MLLTDFFEDTLEYNGKEYDLDLSFNNVLTILELFKDKELNAYQKTATALYLLTDEDVELEPKEMEEFLDIILREYLFSDKETESVQLDIMGNPMPVAAKKQSFNFSHDAGLLYASFQQAYGMDLIEQQGKLHWKKFNALIEGLPDETIFMKVIDIRQRELPTGKGTEKERAHLVKMKEKYKLPKELR